MTRMKRQIQDSKLHANQWKEEIEKLKTRITEMRNHVDIDDPLRDIDMCNTTSFK